MTSKHRTIGAMVAIPVIMCLLGSCSQAPIPSTYIMNAQKKMQAAHHWDILASDIAEQTRLFVGKNGKLKNIPLYVASSHATPFDDIFHNLLVTRLVQQGIVVSNTGDNAIVMEVEATLLRHSGRTINHPRVKYSALATGIKVAHDVADWALGDILSLGVGLGVLADLNRGIDTGDTPDVEVVITTSMVFDSRYMMRKSDIYYIHKPDWWHYGKDRTNDAKTYHVVN